MNENEEFETLVMGLVDNMVGCAVDLNQHNWETLIKTREVFKETIHDKLYKIPD